MFDFEPRSFLLTSPALLKCVVVAAAYLWVQSSAFAQGVVNPKNLCSRTHPTRIEAVDPRFTKAAASGDVKLLAEAFRNGLSANATTEEGWSLLMIAITEHQPAVLDLLLRNGVDVNQPVFGGSALHQVDMSFGAETQELARHMERRLRDHGARYTDRDLAFKEILKLRPGGLARGFVDALEASDMERVRLFVRFAMDINEAIDPNAGFAPLHHAAGMSSPEVISYLVRCGANVNATTARGTPVLHFARERPEVVRLLTDLGATPLP